jgi:hypothetical protein
MESMIDFLRFRLFEREDFITLSPVDLQWRFLRRDAIAAGVDCQRFLKSRGLAVGQDATLGTDMFCHHCCRLLPQPMAVRPCLTAACQNI